MESTTEEFPGQPSGQGDPPIQRTYHPKRPHKKSRKGCRNCKLRKVKCDEGRPACGTCMLRKVQCIYTTPPASQSSATTSTAASTSSSTVSPVSSPAFAASSSISAMVPRQARTTVEPNCVIVEPLFRPMDCDINDMRILWHYTTAASTSFSVQGAGPANPTDEIMRTSVVRHAFETPFLMNSLFALSLLHLQEVNNVMYRDRLISYREKSFEGYRLAIEAADRSTYPALLANSLLLTALSSQSFRDPEGPDMYLIDWMIVWRGIGLIFDLIKRDAVVSTDLQRLFYRPVIDLEAGATAIPDNLLLLITSVTQQDPDYLNITTYFDTLKYLGSLYDNLRNGGLSAVMKLRIITWFTFVPGQFVTLVRQKQPRALVILAHYAAFLKLTIGVWWTVGIGARSLRDFCRYLGPAWYDTLEAPLKVMETDDALEIIRILLHDASWEPPKPLGRLLEQRQVEEVQEVSWVDDQGRPVCIEEENGQVKLVQPQSAEDVPVWHN